MADTKGFDCGELSEPQGPAHTDSSFRGSGRFSPTPAAFITVWQDSAKAKWSRSLDTDIHTEALGFGWGHRIESALL